MREFGTPDVIIAPYLERMNASLFYYKGYDLRREHPKIGEWFDAMETRECYRGTLSDFSTHAYALPLFLGECHFKFDGDLEAAKLVDQGKHLDVNPSSYPEPADSKEEAAYEVIQQHE